MEKRRKPVKGDEVYIKKYPSWGPCKVLRIEEDWCTVQRIDTPGITLYACRPRELKVVVK